VEVLVLATGFSVSQAPILARLEGDGGEDVLEPGLAQSNVAASPKPEPANCLA
jgi:hypothetical protein